MKCYLIRHGITTGNKELKFNGGRTDDPLTEEGRKALKKINVTENNIILCASPMKRAVETAAIMLPDSEPVVIEELREMDFGDFEGRNHSMLDGDPEYQRWLDSGGRMRVPGGESLDEFSSRVRTGLGKAASLALSQGMDALYIVAHGGTIMAAMSFLTGGDYYKFNLPNGAGYEIELELDDEGNVLAAASYEKFCGGLSDENCDWTPPVYTPNHEL